MFRRFHIYGIRIDHDTADKCCDYYSLIARLCNCNLQSQLIYVYSYGAQVAFNFYCPKLDSRLHTVLSQDVQNSPAYHSPTKINLFGCLTKINIKIYCNRSLFNVSRNFLRVLVIAGVNNKLLIHVQRRHHYFVAWRVTQSWQVKKQPPMHIAQSSCSCSCVSCARIASDLITHRTPSSVRQVCCIIHSHNSSIGACSLFVAPKGSQDIVTASLQKSHPERTIFHSDVKTFSEEGAQPPPIPFPHVCHYPMSRSSKRLPIQKYGYAV